MRATFARSVLVVAFAGLGFGQIDGEAAYVRFLRWRQQPENSSMVWNVAVEHYSAKLRREGLSDSIAARTMRIIAARDEAVVYDAAFEGPPDFQTGPSALLVEAVQHRRPGKALDVGMGQGRNSIFLAQEGWEVSGFDVSRAGLDEAKRLAAKAGVEIETIHGSDEEFDFGVERWDLIAILYPIEKRSVYRVQRALKPGGLVVVECAHIDAAKAGYAYGTNELLEIFEGFRIIKYQDSARMHEWAGQEMRLVSLIAKK